MEAEQQGPTTMEPILGYYTSYFSPREFEIAEIMVGLPDIISELDDRPRIRVPWGHKKKRSALAVQDQRVRNNKSPSSSTVVRLRLLSSSSSPSPGSKVPATNVVKVERSSPNTPLSFESDEKPSQLRSKVVVGKREIQNVKDYKEKLIKFNVVLQSRKQELKMQRLIQKEPRSKIEEQKLNLDMKLGQPTPIQTSIVICAPTIVEQERYHQLSAPHHYQTLDHTAQTRGAVIIENHGYLSSTTQVASTSLPSSSVNATGLRLVSCNNNGGLIPDHGFSSFPNQNCGSAFVTKNLYRAVSAQRRHERYQKNRVKKTSLSGQRRSQEL
ncbi:uncharacterized protein LOC112172260 isoform X2 [Rosa chinensis]|uniref:uncharacterized protein LOC112172260 isoform X2 n=1 Tax=Rosa chinensis TaxID=74649 RepID=UPI000D08C049|nr:uncharacterized protein LOC112172260 isoform X2 [Rosa chinensis]